MEEQSLREDVSKAENLYPADFSVAIDYTQHVWGVTSTQEFISAKPVIVLAFGQPTHRLLVSAYHRKIKPDMQGVFGKVFPVHNPISMLYLPVIRYNSRWHQYYRTRWPVFLQEIKG